MKTIAVLFHNIKADYTLDVITGINAFFKDKKDIRYIIAQTCVPNEQDGQYTYQFWANYEFLLSDEIDAYIVITGSYTSIIDLKTLSKLLKYINPKKPVISLAAPLDLPNSWYLVTDSQDAYDEIVSHLKNVHNCKRILFMSANLTESPEAKNRYVSFVAALKNNGLSFNKTLVLDGNFTINSAKKAFSQRYKSKEDIDFDAIVAANDLMALGCAAICKNLGVAIPEDVKIIGFDDTYHAQMSSPSLSTISQQIFNQGYKAADVTYKILQGEKVPKKSLMCLAPVYRQSCGCIDLTSTELIYKNRLGQTVYQGKENNASILGRLEYRLDVSRINDIIDLSKSSDTLGDFHSKLIQILEKGEMYSAAVCLFNFPITMEKNDIIAIPNNLNCIMYSNQETKKELFDAGIRFDIREKLFPPDLFADEPGNYFLQPIFSGDTLYGYLICRLKNDTYSIYSVYIRILITEIAKAYEYTLSLDKSRRLETQNIELLRNNSNLNLQSKTDELTEILNRRGFMEIGQQEIDNAVIMGREGYVFFADMDGLKKINDTYGHKMGDIAIKTQAEILMASMRSTDIVGRLSGDEFAIIAIGMPDTHIGRIKEKIQKYNEEFSIEKNLPFKLSISLGAVKFNSENHILQDLLISADEQLYIEKKNKKGQK